MFTENEAKVFVSMLDEASDNFGRAICNDFSLPNTHENWELYLKYHEYLKMVCDGYGDEDLEKRPRKGPICFTNYLLFDYFIDRVKDACDIGREELGDEQGT